MGTGSETVSLNDGVDGLSSQAILAHTEWRTRRLFRSAFVVGHIRFATLLAADVCAFLFAGMIGKVCAGSINLTNLLCLMPSISWLTAAVSWHLPGLALLVAIFCVNLASSGHYTQRIGTWTEIREIVGCALFVVLCDFMLDSIMFAKPVTADCVTRWLALVPLLLFGRSTARALLRRTGFWNLRTVFVGDAVPCERLKTAIQSEPSLGYQIVGKVAPQTIRQHGSVSEVRELLDAYGAEFLAIATGLDPEGEAMMVGALHRARIPFALAPTTNWPVLYGQPQYFFSYDVTLLNSRHRLTEPFGRAAKVAFDFTLALILLVLNAPLMVAIAYLVRRDGGPAIFRHPRLGENGRTFQCIKFRSMRVDGDRILATLLANDPEAAAEWARDHKLRNDLRVTRLGRILRRTSLDELPQLLNILRGEMSFVGPRPIVQSETRLYGQDINYYYDTRPGLTGLWQVSGRNDLSYERRVQLDVWYVKNWTFWHDVAILLKTVPAVLKRRGAC